MNSKILHSIKYNKKGNDCITTPVELAKYCISLVPLTKGSLILDPARGNGSFFNNFPSYVIKDYCELNEGMDFFNYTKETDWAITNPPYSILDEWLIHSARLCKKGFGYLLGINNITPRRIENMNKMNFGLTHLHLCKVFKYMGMSIFVIFEKGKPNIISYDRIVWR